jgi:hypothetical protein
MDLFRDGVRFGTQGQTLATGYNLQKNNKRYCGVYNYRMLWSVVSAVQIIGMLWILVLSAEVVWVSVQIFSLL